VKDTDQPSAVFDIVSAPRKFFSVSDPMEQALLDEKHVIFECSRNPLPSVMEFEGSCHVHLTSRAALSPYFPASLTTIKQLLLPGVTKETQDLYS
jgi:hypothetical protein